MANTNKIIVLDDGSAGTNPLPTPYLDATLQTVRVNSTVSNVKGILGYGFNTYRIQLLAGAGNAPVVSVARPAVPAFAKLDVKALTDMNVEAIVTGVYATLNPGGFYIQEEDADSDGDVIPRRPSSWPKRVLR